MEPDRPAPARLQEEAEGIAAPVSAKETRLGTGRVSADKGAVSVAGTDRPVFAGRMDGKASRIRPVVLSLMNRPALTGCSARRIH